jgi:D-alanyl-D-alanine carboxypeptidase/D-alanyl-D-alanine-endopeptidase (penicillin-binding protein 4)
MQPFLRAFVFLFFVTGAPPPEFAADSARLLRADLDRIFSDSRLSDAQLGIEIYSLDRAEVMYSKNPSKLYMPASNNKILTIAAALACLGPDYHFKTRVSADGPIVDGVLQGHLIIQGFGDPTSSSRIPPKNPFQTFREWALKLKQQGVRAISGNLIGDGGSFEEIAYGRGWEWDDLEDGSVAPVSALQFNENRVWLEITPGLKPGSLAAIKMEPLANYLTLDSKISTEAAVTPVPIEVQRSRSGEAALLRGIVPVDSAAIQRSIAVQYPVRYYLSALRQALSEEGIDTTNCGIVEMRGVRSQPSSLLWIHSSPPLSDLIAPMMKLSLNLGVETIVRVLGLELRGEGAFIKGKEVVEEALERMGVGKESCSYADGSGLSRLNLVSADALIRVLGYMRRQTCFSYFYGALPVAGVDGTLELRMKGTKAENNVHAKTGSLAKVSSLSGYVQTADGEMMAFSMLANNFLVSRDVVESMQDKALIRLAGFTRKAHNKQRTSGRQTPNQ